MPIHYFHYGLYQRCVNSASIERYLPETIFYYHLLPKINRYHVLLDDKIHAEEIKRASSIPIPKTVFVRRLGVWLDNQRRPITSLGEFELALNSEPTEGIIIKPAFLTSGGEGVKALRKDCDGNWRDDYSLVSLANLYNSAGDDLIVQHRETNGGSLARFGSNVLECFRVLTVYEDHGPVALYVILKLSSGNSVVDNGHAGGVYVTVDLDKGDLGSIGIDERGELHTDHPYSHVSFAGFVVHEIASIQECAIQAARAFPSLKVIGWDIALTDRGPVVIEGNSSPGLALIQRPWNGAPLLIDYFRRQNLL